MILSGPELLSQATEYKHDPVVVSWTARVVQTGLDQFQNSKPTLRDVRSSTHGHALDSQPRPVPAGGPRRAAQAGEPPAGRQLQDTGHWPHHAGGCQGEAQTNLHLIARPGE